MGSKAEYVGPDAGRLVDLVVKNEVVYVQLYLSSQ